MKAAREGGLNESEVAAYLESGDDRISIKSAMRRADGELDGVPYIVICGLPLDRILISGRRRDFKISGTVKEDQYLKTFIQVDKEFN
jgi:predicted DsbA family dithiol-disulfide isomerase